MPETTTAICKLVRAGHTALRLLNYLSRREGETFGDMRGDGVVTDDARLDATNLVLEHDGRRACEVRHVIMSFPSGAKVSIEDMRGICLDWVGAYAPDRKWLAKIHSDREHLHIHLVVANVGKEGYALALRPHMVKAMAVMAFTSRASAAGECGNRGLKIYTRGEKELLAMRLAKMSRREKYELINNGTLKLVARSGGRKSTSVEYDGVRIRISTIVKCERRLAAARRGSVARPENRSLPHPASRLDDGVARGRPRREHSRGDRYAHGLRARQLGCAAALEAKRRSTRAARCERERDGLLPESRPAVGERRTQRQRSIPSVGENPSLAGGVGGGCFSHPRSGR